MSLRTMVSGESFRIRPPSLEGFGRMALSQMRSNARASPMVGVLSAMICIVFLPHEGFAAGRKSIRRTSDHATDELASLRQAAAAGDPVGQRNLAIAYAEGVGVAKNPRECLRWATRAAKQGDTVAQCLVGKLYETGYGVARNQEEAMRWYTMAAEAGDAFAQQSLGCRYIHGRGVVQDFAKAEHWLMRSAQQGNAGAQIWLAWMYFTGEGVEQDTKLAYMWAYLSNMSSSRTATTINREFVAHFAADLESRLTTADVLDAQQSAVQYVAKRGDGAATEKFPEEQLPEVATKAHQHSTGSGFFITTSGYFVTNYHVVEEAKEIRIKTTSGLHAARIVYADSRNDVAILKVDGDFPALHVRGSRELRMADRVATVGYPTPDVQGLAAKYSSGEVAALSGLGDDARLFQISVPIQPGNSGGPLIDISGSVVGVIVAQWDKAHAIAEKGIIPENVNYAIKGTILLSAIEMIPEALKNLVPPPAVEAINAADVAARVEPATGLVLVAR